jgi:hypothetical protein
LCIIRDQTFLHPQKFFTYIHLWFKVLILNSNSSLISMPFNQFFCISSHETFSLFLSIEFSTFFEHNGNRHSQFDKLQYFHPYLFKKKFHIFWMWKISIEIYEGRIFVFNFCAVENHSVDMSVTGCGHWYWMGCWLVNSKWLSYFEGW